MVDATNRGFTHHAREPMSTVVWRARPTATGGGTGRDRQARDTASGPLGARLAPLFPGSYVPGEVFRHDR
jgi:hypothetical protein